MFIKTYDTGNFKLIILSIFFSMVISNSANSQVDNHLFELNQMDSLLTLDVRQNLKKNLENKRVIFLGESEHHIGSDFLAKTEFVKFLVEEEGYKDIVFESDFFGLYFDHKKNNVFYHWYRSKQCQELFEYLDKKNVKIWGLDIITHSYFTYQNFEKKLIAFLKLNDITYDDRFLNLANIVLTNGSKSYKKMNNNEAIYLIDYLEKLQENPKVRKNSLWHQFLKSFQSTVQIYTVKRKKKAGIPIRDQQMADNLDFLVKDKPNKKFMVWVANAHMSKLNEEFMNGKTMGYQFLEKNPDISYHIAFSPIHMPYIKNRKIEKMHEDENDLLHFLPTTTDNYYIDSKSLIQENSSFINKKFEGLFHLDEDYTTWFAHYDALVFIGKGIKSEILE